MYNQFTTFHCVSALSFASGQGAAAACMMILKNGDHILASEDIYGGKFFAISNSWFF